MASFRQIIEESYDELVNKVSWPTWKELQSSSLIVLIATFITAFLIYLMDTVFSNVMKFIYTNIF
ncbi:MAG: preprotein translocase subunit SecE [Bacteroidetes bacterium]|nr:MAG: preprotein translocase subunit SecE [Bacteroidota bacterium]